MRIAPSTAVLAASVLACAAPPDSLPSSAAIAAPASDEWPAYGRDRGGSRFSPLASITRDNVSRLREAWRYRTRETDRAFATRSETSLEATPIVVDGTMYLATPLGRVIALDR